MNIGHVIAQCRAQKNIGQKELASALHVSVSTVGLWETNRRFPSPTTLIELADFFNISMDTLFSADRTITAFTPSQKQLDPDAERLLKYFESMNEESKEIIMGEARKLLREQRLEEKRDPSSLAGRAQ